MCKCTPSIPTAAWSGEGRILSPGPQVPPGSGGHLLPVGFLPLDQAAPFQRDASEEPPGPAVGEDSCRTPEGHIAFQVPVEDRGGIVLQRLPCQALQGLRTAWRGCPELSELQHDPGPRLR